MEHSNVNISSPNECSSPTHSLEPINFHRLQNSTVNRKLVYGFMNLHSNPSRNPGAFLVPSYVDP